MSQGRPMCAVGDKINQRREPYNISCKELPISE